MNRYERGDLAAKLYTEGQLIIREIAERLGVSGTTIWRDLRDRNVSMRPPPEFYRIQRLARQAERRRAA
jgi:predicted HTH domain antitoxin